jgi:hypothetical protein
MLSLLWVANRSRGQFSLRIRRQLRASHCEGEERRINRFAFSATAHYLVDLLDMPFLAENVSARGGKNFLSGWSDETDSFSSGVE